MSLTIEIETEGTTLLLNDDFGRGIHLCHVCPGEDLGLLLLTAEQCRELALALLDFADRLDPS